MEIQFPCQRQSTKASMEATAQNGPGSCLKPSLGPACHFSRFFIRVNVDSVRGTEQLTSCVDADFTTQIWNDTWGKRITSSTQTLNDKAVIICVLKCWWAWCWRPTSMWEFSLGAEHYSVQLVVVLLYSMLVLYAPKSMAAFQLSCSNKRPLLLMFLFCTHSVCHLLSLFFWHRCWHLFFFMSWTSGWQHSPLDPPPLWRCDSNLSPLSGSDVSAGLPTGTLQQRGLKGGWGDGGKKKRVQLRFSHFARCATLAGDCWVVWGDVGITHAQLKPLGHFFEEFGDQYLNRQPLLVRASWNQLLRQPTFAS